MDFRLPMLGTEDVSALADGLDNTDLPRTGPTNIGVRLLKVG